MPIYSNPDEDFLQAKPMQSKVPLDQSIQDHHHTNLSISTLLNHCLCKDIPTRPSQSKSRRNLVVCIDGTSNQFGEKNTNVVELYSRLVKNKHQLTFYNSGIGTYAKPSWQSISYQLKRVDNFIDMGIAWNFESIIFKAYQWLSENFEPGDRIFLFGFSRGAYQVRALAGMIEKVGLIYRGNETQIPFAYELYAASKKSSPVESTTSIDGGKSGNCKLHAWQRLFRKDSGSPVDLTGHFRETFSQKGVRVHFVGVWDTVSSVGVVRHKTLPLTTAGMDHVCYFRHALALDEHRVKFLPEYSHGGTSVHVHKPASGEPKVKEVWFAGSHSDVGGGNTINTELDKFGPATRWMSLQAMSAGLQLLPFQKEWVKEVHIHQSMTWYWRVLEFFPLQRRCYVGQKKFTHWPNLGQRRRVVNGQLIHQSASEAKDITSRVHLPHDWNRDINHAIEPDSFVEVSNLLKDIEDCFSKLKQNKETISEPQNDTPMNEALTKLAGSLKNLSVESCMLLVDWENSHGSEKLRNLLLSGWLKQAPDQYSILYAITDILSQSILKGAIPRLRFLDVYPTLSVLLESRCSTCVHQARDFLYYCTTAEELCMTPHTKAVTAVEIFQDGRVISGSVDSMLKIWRVDREEDVNSEELQQHTSAVQSIAIFVEPKNAVTYIASSADDGTIIIQWTAETFIGRLTTRFQAHDGPAHAVAFSGDGKLLASGGEDGKVKTWNIHNTEIHGESLEGHTAAVHSVDFSKDGRYVVSGADDHTVRVWDLEDKLQIRHFRHTQAVQAVAFSPTGQMIVSAASTQARVWDWKNLSAALLFEEGGHEQPITCVAFSPNDRFIVSGSSDNSIGIWDVNMQRYFGYPIGTESSVTSVAFSPDARYIVAGYSDGKVGVWDFSKILGQNSM
ncbi:WD40 repeat-like protein [Lentinula edodes]|nr:WD40 repeat-like protein [Lentinula edodes]